MNNSKVIALLVGFIGVFLVKITYAEQYPDAERIINEPKDKGVFIESKPPLVVQHSVELPKPDLPSPEGGGIENRIAQLMSAKDWKAMLELLDAYQRVPDYDRVLYDYAMGAYYRHIQDYGRAIELYNKITQDESLVYPKFDLAIMLFEDKQYRRAKRIFDEIYYKLPPSFQMIANQYRKAIEQDERVITNFEINYEKTDNVNNASSLKEIKIGEWLLVRDEDSLPQSATGVNYEIGLSKRINIEDHHYLQGDISIDGTHYWDNQDFSERRVRGELGYWYRDHHHGFGFMPFTEQNWQDSEKYHRQHGVNITYQERLNENMSANIFISYANKRYEDPKLSRLYDGRVYRGSAMISRSIGDGYFYFGADNIIDKVRDESESSKRMGVRFGGGFIGNKWAYQMGANYMYRQFEAPNFWYQRVRQDNEYRMNASIWNQQIHWLGLVPKLNFQYQHINSNLPLYDRQNNSWFISVDKMF